MNIPGGSILSVVHMYQASRVREDQSEESTGQTWELLPTYLFREIPWTHEVDGFSLYAWTHSLSLSHTLTHIHIYNKIGLVPCEGAFHCVCHRDWISSCFPQASSFQVSLVSPPHCCICDLEFVCCLSLLWLCCDCSFCPVWLLSCFIIRDRCGSPPVPGAEATEVLTLESEAALPQHQSISWWFQLICYFLQTGWSQHGLHCILHSLLIKMFHKNRKVVMHFSYKKYAQLIYNSTSYGISTSISLSDSCWVGALHFTGCLGLWRRLSIPTEDRLCRNVNTDLGCRTDKCQVDWEMRTQRVWIWGQLLISCANLINLCNFLKLHLFNGNNNILIVWGFNVMV